MSAFEELGGLPGTGPRPEQFSATGRGTHSEGFVVRFVPQRGAAWVGNFQPGLTECRGVYRHPDGAHMLVVSGGQGYVIDAETRSLVETIGGAILAVHERAQAQLLVLDHQGIEFEALGRAGRAWRSGRLSWDGFRHVEFGEQEIVGEGWNAVDSTWQPFRVDLSTGRSSGGAYHMSDGPDQAAIARRGRRFLRVPRLEDPRVLFEVRRIGILPAWLQVVLVVGLFLVTVFLANAEYRAHGTTFGIAGPAFNALVCPIYEELIFRGWILGRLTRWRSPWYGVAVSSALFGMLHLRNVFWLEPRPLVGVVVYSGAVVGPVLAYVTLRCRSVWPAVILHYLNNLSYFLRH